MPQLKVSPAELRPDAANTGDTQIHRDVLRDTRMHTHTPKEPPGAPCMYISDTDCVCIYI